MQELPESARKFEAAARALGLDIRIREMAESTRTAEEAAAACRCDVAQIVKSLVFKGRESGRPYLLLVSGRNRVDEESMTSVLGETLARADAAFVRSVTGYAIGGVPPVGHATPVPTFLDEDLLGFDQVWAAAGTPRCLFAVDPARLRDAASARVIRMR